ncbi:hypothetical protein [Corynebacterium bouchesdurhonense]|nr:hypothetical protein [Corynebacterium bouchesdurhonense]
MPADGLTGTVTDKNHKPITGAKVIVDPTTGAIKVSVPEGTPPKAKQRFRSLTRTETPSAIQSTSTSSVRAPRQRLSMSAVHRNKYQRRLN